MIFGEQNWWKRKGRMAVASQRRPPLRIYRLSLNTRLGRRCETHTADFSQLFIVSLWGVPRKAEMSTRARNYLRHIWLNMTRSRLSRSPRHVIQRKSRQIPTQYWLVAKHTHFFLLALQQTRFPHLPDEAFKMFYLHIRLTYSIEGQIYVIMNVNEQSHFAISWTLKLQSFNFWHYLLPKNRLHYT